MVSQCTGAICERPLGIYLVFLAVRPVCKRNLLANVALHHLEFNYNESVPAECVGDACGCTLYGSVRCIITSLRVSISGLVSFRPVHKLEKTGRIRERTL
jgi:hypothetical protein